MIRGYGEFYLTEVVNIDTALIRWGGGVICRASYQSVLTHILQYEVHTEII